MNRIVRLAPAFALLSLVFSTGVAFAQIVDFTVTLLNDPRMVAEYADAADMRFDPASGLSFAVVGTDADAVPTDVGSAREFRLGDYVVLCFTPLQSMYIQILDTTPSGRTHQLYPAEGAVPVLDGRRYCAGDGSSELYFYADEASGIGEGVLWIYGTRRQSDVARAGDWPVPQGPDSSAEFGTTIRREGTFEAWYRYSVIDD